MHSNTCARSADREQARSLGPRLSDSEAITERVAAIPLINLVWRFIGGLCRIRFPNRLRRLGKQWRIRIAARRLNMKNIR